MKIIICGITGSIGTQTIDVIKDNSNITLVGATFFSNEKMMQKILIKYPKIKIYSPKINRLNNVDSLEQMIDILKPDLILNSIPGFEGLKISLLALENKINLALANKESLVLAGWYLFELASKSNVKIFPIDSEHCSLFDLLENNKKTIKQLYITASGGNFYNKSLSELKSISFKEAIVHPNWKMGYKISIDSSTLLNKCFEIIEAFYLFKTDKIKALYHPQSIIHSLVEFSDDSIFANLSSPDMKIAIQIMFNFFSNFKNSNSFIKPLSFNNLNLHLDQIDLKKYLPIKWAYDFIKSNNKAIPIILVCANDIAIELFKLEKITFDQIILTIQKTIVKFKRFKIEKIEDIFTLDFLIKSFLLKN